MLAHVGKGFWSERNRKQWKARSSENFALIAPQDSRWPPTCKTCLAKCCAWKVHGFCHEYTQESANWFLTFPHWSPWDITAAIVSILLLLATAIGINIKSSAFCCIIERWRYVLSIRIIIIIIIIIIIRQPEHLRNTAASSISKQTIAIYCDSEKWQIEKPNVAPPWNYRSYQLWQLSMLWSEVLPPCHMHPLPSRVILRFVAAVSLLCHENTDALAFLWESGILSLSFTPFMEA